MSCFEESRLKVILNFFTNLNKFKKQLLIKTCNQDYQPTKYKITIWNTIISSHQRNRVELCCAGEASEFIIQDKHTWEC